MKYPVLLQGLFFLIPAFVTAQTLEVSYEGKRIVPGSSTQLEFSVKEPATGNSSTYLQMKIQGRYAGTTALVTVNSLSTGTASLGQDYTFDNLPGQYSIGDSDNQFVTLGINILSDNIPEADETITFSVSYIVNGKSYSYPLTITIQDQKNSGREKMRIYFFEASPGL